MKTEHINEKNIQHFNDFKRSYVTSAFKLQSLNLFLCRHFDTISDLEFNCNSLQFVAISSFSFRQRLHLFDTGLYGKYLPRIDHFRSGIPPSSLMCHTSFESSVSFLYRILLNDILWFPNLLLKVVEQMPLQCLIFLLGRLEETEHWQSMSFSKQFPSSGHIALRGQLQDFVLVRFCGGSCNILRLCRLIWPPTFVVHEQLIFSVFLLNTLLSLWWAGKCLSIRLKKYFPILVITDRLYGGLN